MRKLSIFLIICSFAEFARHGCAGLSNVSQRTPRKTAYVSTLTRSPGKTSRAGLRLRQETTGSGVLYSSNPIGRYFLAGISIGSQSFKVILDTGSSDLWLAQAGYTCYDKSTNEPTTSNMCNMGPTYTSDGSFTQIPNENFLSQYEEGTFAAGPIGYDSVTLAGLTVPQQELGLAQELSLISDGTASGLVGLAFPALTSAHNVANQSLDSSDNLVEYNSLLYTIFESDTFNPPLTPQFSLAISRDQSGTNYAGSFAIGGIPDPTDPRVNSSSNSVTAPWEYVTDVSTTQYSFYAISLDGLEIGDSYEADSSQFMVDSGTTLMVVPTALANAFNDLWEPSASTASDGSVLVDCDAIPPQLSVVVNGVAIPINPADLKWYNGENCLSGIQDAGSGRNWLGDVFLRNVLAVFDWGNQEMIFYPRENYES